MARGPWPRSSSAALEPGGGCEVGTAAKPVAPGGSAAFLTWEADDWDQLGSYWSELFPEKGGRPKFRSQELVSQQAGWVFERWILEAFRLSGAVGHYSYGNRQEQIDGLVFDGWQGFLIESK